MVRSRRWSVEDPELLKRTQSWNGSLDTVWATRIAGNDDIAVVGQVSPAHGWLVDVDRDRQCRRSRLSTRKSTLGKRKRLGYGSHADQYDWRNEKADRQVRQCFALAEFLRRICPSARASSISDLAMGTFSQPLRGVRSWGRYRRKPVRRGRAHERFSVETFVGTLEAFTPSEPYDLLTMWDCIEHVSNPARSSSAPRNVPVRAHCCS